MSEMKIKIIIDIVLVIVSILVFIYNFSLQREVTYMASVVAVCGTSIYLLRDIIKVRKCK